MDESTVEMRRLIEKVAERHGIHIDLNDPAFYVLSLNEFALEESTKTITEQIRRAAGDLEASAERVQERVGVFVAEQMNNVCAAHGHESAKDTATSGVIEKIKSFLAPTKSAMEWLAIGILSTLLIFASGVVVGIALIKLW